MENTFTANVDCYLDKEPFHQCCCKCIHRRPVHHHCWTSPGLRKLMDSCCCRVQKGWACVLPLELTDVVTDNWPEHSIGCEMYTTAEVAGKTDHENSLPHKTNCSVGDFDGSPCNCGEKENEKI